MTLLLPDAPEIDEEPLEYSPIDEEALRRAIRIVKFRDPSRAEQISSFLKDRPWTMVGEFCSAILQVEALGLRPWESPPALAADAKGEQLAERMVEAGLSQFEPDVVNALRKRNG
jgi:hypothetical protein